MILKAGSWLRNINNNLYRKSLTDSLPCLYLSVASGKVTRLNSQVMIGGGRALILQVKRATEPSVTTMEEGCWVNVEIPVKREKETDTVKYNYLLTELWTK